MKIILTGLISLFCFHYAISQIKNDEIPRYPNEAINYSLKYGFVKVGIAHLEFGQNKDCRGAFIVAYAKSSGLLKLIRNIHFQYECCMDTATGLPITDARILNEGGYVDNSIVYYNRQTRKDSALIYSVKTGTVVVPKNIYDLLSGFYHYRANHLAENMPADFTVSTTTFFVDEIWELTIRYCGVETIDTRYGRMECIKVKPVTIVGKFFQSTDAMTIWFSNKGNYLPVRFSVELRLGTLYGDIIDGSNLAL